MIMDQRTEQIALTAVLDGIQVRVMVDSGANRNYASRDLGQRLRKYQRKREMPYSLSMANGNTSRPVDTELHDVPMTIGEHEERITLDLTDLKKYDAVLGMAWLHRHNPTIDWRSRTLEFTNCRTCEEDRSSSKVPVAKAIWVRPRGRNLDELDAHELPSEYQDFKELFKEREKLAALPEHKPWDHKIEYLEGCTPKHKGWQKQLSPKEAKFLKEYLAENKAKGFIRKSKSEISHGMLFVSKKDGGLRPCVDFRPTNAITRRNQFPIPLINELQDRVGGKSWYTALDVRDAFYRVRMAKGEEWKTAFTTTFGLWEYQVMPFGLTNAPATFQELINDTLKEFLGDFVVAYLDDILIYSDTLEQHIDHVRKVMKALQARDLPLKLSKCEFHKQRVAFLGYIISKQGLEPDPKKIEAIAEWPEPRNVKDVQSFLGLANYYRRFIKGFSEVAAPLTALTKKDTWFEFGEKCREAFKELKQRLTTSPILRIFDHEKEAFLETDASDYAIGAVLNQKDENGKLVPTAFYSRKMTEPELNYDIHDKELMAIVEAMRHWRVYLEGAKFPVQVYTDHKNLTYWTTTKELNRRQVRWAEVLTRYDFKITHVRGTENGRADALSRRSDYEEGSKPRPAALLKWNGRDLVYKQPDQSLMMINEFKPTEEQKQQIISGRHDDKGAGHKGIAKTIELITRDFVWPGLRKDVEEYIRNCDMCKKTKHERHKPYGLLQIPETPDKPWKNIALDFIVKLPKSKEPLTKTEYDSILVTGDELTKMTHFVPWKEAATAEELAYALIRHVVSQHGLPETIKSDRGSVFTSAFWQSFMDLTGTHQKLSTAYHPQTDGQIERTNQTLEQYLRSYVNYYQNNWVELLPIAEFAYNNSASITGISPFFANYGRHPRFDMDIRGMKPVAERAQIRTNEMKKVHEIMKNKLEKIHKQTAKQANKKRSEGPDFQKGEKVYILRKNIKTTRPSSKLDYTKIGPYKIKEKLGPVTYEIELPVGMNIYPVFHKSLLEKAPQNAKPGPVLVHPETQEPMWDVEKILDFRPAPGAVKYGIKGHYLVKWLGYDNSENTWEPTENLPPEMMAEYHRKTTHKESTGTTKAPRVLPTDREPTENEYCDLMGAGFHDTPYSIQKDYLYAPDDISEILRHKKVNGRLQYLVKWKGKNTTNNTWVAEGALPPDTVGTYHRTRLYSTPKKEAPTRPYITTILDFRCPDSKPDHYDRDEYKVVWSNGNTSWETKDKVGREVIDNIDKWEHAGIYMVHRKH
jgi:transposase InsO family protein